MLPRRLCLLYHSVFSLWVRATPWSWIAWTRVLALPLSSSVTFGKLLNLCASISPFVTWSLFCDKGPGELKHFEQCLSPVRAIGVQATAPPELWRLT